MSSDQDQQRAADRDGRMAVHEADDAAPRLHRSGSRSGSSGATATPGGTGMTVGAFNSGSSGRARCRGGRSSG